MFDKDKNNIFFLNNNNYLDIFHSTHAAGWPPRTMGNNLQHVYIFLYSSCMLNIFIIIRESRAMR